MSFQLVAAKVLVRKDSEDDQSPKISDINAMLTPFKVKHSYENMTLIDEGEEDGPKGRKILEYSYEEEPEEKSCCWCCIPIWCCGSKSRKKKKGSVKTTVVAVSDNGDSCPQSGAEVKKSSSTKSLSLCDVMVSLPSQPSSPIKSGSTFFKTRKLSHIVEVNSDIESPSSKSDYSVQELHTQFNDALSSKDVNKDENVSFNMKDEEISFQSTVSEKKEKTKSKKAGKKKSKSDSTLEAKNQLNGKTKHASESDKEIEFNKENTDPCIWDIHKNGYSNSRSKSPKSSPPKTLDTTPTSAMKRSETYELVERWKSEGRQYQTARDQFFSYFDTNIQGRIIRYFEQERKTLVLTVNLDDKMAVCTISMTTREVKRLWEDYELGQLHEDLVRCVRPQDIIDKMECCAIHLRSVINDEDFTLSFQELS